MVRVVSLRAENFRRLNISEPLVFPSGFIIVRGRNEAGKSTLIEAILYGLYGDHNIPGALRGGERLGLEGIVNHGAKRARIEVEFEVGGKRYKVERILEREGDSARQIDASLVELSDGEARLLARGASKVSEMVQKLVRVSWREMLVTNVIAQKDLERIIEMGRSERERVINMMMGFESYNKAIDKLRREMRELQDGLERARAEAEELARRIAELEERGRELEKRKAELERLEGGMPELEREAEREKTVFEYLSEVEKLLARKRELRQQIETERRRLGEVLKELEDTRRQLGQLASRLGQLRAEKSKLEPEREMLEKELESIDGRLKQLNEVFASANNLLESQRQLASKLEEVRGRIRSLAASIQAGRREALERRRREAEEALARVQQAKVAVRMPAWSIVGAAAAATLSLLAALLHPAALAGLALAVLLALLGVQAKHRQLMELETAAGRLKDEILEVEGELRRLERDEGELRELESREAELEAQLEGLRSRLSLLAAEVGVEPEALSERLRGLIEAVESERRGTLMKLGTLDKRIRELEAEIRAGEGLLEHLKDQISDRESFLAQLGERARALEEAYSTLSVPEPPFAIEGLQWPLSERDYELIGRLRLERQERYVEAQRRLAEVKEGVRRLREWIESTERELEQLPNHKARFEELRGKIRELELRARAVGEAVRALEDVARRRREAFAPSVESNMSWIVAYVTNGRYKAVRIDPQTYDVEVYDSEAGRWMRRDIYSGGTNDQFLLAMRIAFTLSLLPAAKGTYPRFLFLDEPLGSSDSERRDLIVKLLSEELTRFFDQVFLVTHVDIDEPPGSTLIVMEDGKPREVRRTGPLEGE